MRLYPFDKVLSKHRVLMRSSQQLRLGQEPGREKDESLQLSETSDGKGWKKSAALTTFARSTDLPISLFT